MPDSKLLYIDDTVLKDFRPRYDIRLVLHCAQAFNWAPSFARCVVRDALRFLALCAVPPAGNENTDTAHVMVCSPIVDKVVDAVMLDTPLLMWLERTVFGGVRLMHVPAYAHGANPAINNARYEMTIAMMHAVGYDIDTEIWPDRLAANCLTCHCGNDLDDCQMYALPREN